METPAELVSVHNEAKLPGLSLIITLNLNNRPTAINPRSRLRPKMFESIFPPQRMTATLKYIQLGLVRSKCIEPSFYLLFLNSFNCPDKIAAKPAQPSKKKKR